MHHPGHRTRIGAALGVLLSTAAFAQVAVKPGAPIKPRTPTGFSTIEQRYVYAQPDEGSFEFDLRLGNGAVNEVMLEEPSMCSGSAHARVSYSKSHNKVEVDVWYKGLPYRMGYTRPVDVSTPYNRFPVSVQDGKWQVWFVGRMFNFTTTVYYDPQTLQLLGHEEDLLKAGGIPVGAIPVELPTLHMFGSPMFEGAPDGDAHAHFEFRYDRMLDDRNKGGVYLVYAPYNLCKPDEYGVLYTDGGLAPAKALTFDQVLQSIWGGYGMALATSLEPDPKPSYLDSRDNTMIAWAGAYPMAVPEGVYTDPVSGTYVMRTSCGTHINKPFPTGYFNVCGGH